MALTRSTDLLVWIDCEMTGLNPETDIILSISCIVTSSTLEPLDHNGYHATISTPPHVLESMSPWCIETHGATGLTTACLKSTTTAHTASSQLLQYIKQYCPEPKTALLAGNSVHVDKLFLMREPWSPIIEWLHYRILDVSAIKEGVRRWCSEEVLRACPVKKAVHTAREDVLESIDEGRFYMRLLGAGKTGDGQDVKGEEPGREAKSRKRRQGERLESVERQRTKGNTKGIQSEQTNKK